MSNEEEEKEEGKKKTKAKKKLRKDKWGQTLPTSAEEECDPYEPSEQVQSEFEPRKIVVSGMPYSATEDEIREFFSDIGIISQLQLSTFPDSGNFRGLAFLTFPTEELAIKSLELDGAKMGNRFIKVERCRLNPQRKRKSEFLDEPKKVEGSFSAYIGNLSWEVTEEDIRECFKASKITSIRFAHDRNGDFRGFGHIDFADDESLESAMKKNQVELHGRPLKIAYAVSNRN